LRLHGDVYGKMTNLLLPAAYVTAAELARDNGQFAKALAYAKASETMGAQTLATGYAVEAQIWEMLGRIPNATAALKEAWQRGSQEAHAKLAERYPEALRETAAPAPTRKDAPAFRAVTLDGKELDSTQLRGKVMVANFWFTGCGPCKAEIPELNKLTKEFQGKDVVFLAFTLDDDETTLRRFLKEYPFDYTIVPRSDKIAAQFGIESYPSHVVVGQDGKIESRLIGGGEHRAEELRTIMARLIGK
jgi:thiol-disulfide isomerase/thioredoxin